MAIVKTFVAGCTSGMMSAFKSLDEQFNNFFSTLCPQIAIQSLLDSIHITPTGGNNVADYVVARVVIYYYKV